MKYRVLQCISIPRSMVGLSRSSMLLVVITIAPYRCACSSTEGIHDTSTTHFRYMLVQRPLGGLYRRVIYHRSLSRWPFVCWKSLRAQTTYVGKRLLCTEEFRCFFRRAYGCYNDPIHPASPLAKYCMLSTVLPVSFVPGDVMFFNGRSSCRDTGRTSQQKT